MAGNDVIMVPRSAPSDPGGFQMYRTQMRESPEDIYQPIYDRVNYAAAGAFELSFFSVVVGGSATLIRGGVAATVTKTRRDTNLEQQGVIPTKSFKMIGLSVAYIPLQQAVAGAATQSIVDDMQRLAFGGFLEWRIVDKPYLYLPLHQIPGPRLAGTAGGAFTAGNVAVSAGGFGTGAPRDIYTLGIPLVLDPYQNFSLRMQFDGSPALIQTFDIQVLLHGYIRRPGQ